MMTLTLRTGLAITAVALAAVLPTTSADAASPTPSTTSADAASPTPSATASPCSTQTAAATKNQRKLNLGPAKSRYVFSHDTLSKQFTPADNGLPTVGIPGKYTGADLPGPKTITYRWILTPARSVAAARASAVAYMLRADATMIAAGWERLEDMTIPVYRPGKSATSIGAMTERTYTKDGIRANVRVNRTARLNYSMYNEVSISAYKVPPSVIITCYSPEVSGR